MSADTGTPEDRGVTRWGVVLAAFGAGMMAAGHIGKLPATLPIIRGEFDLNLVTAGWIVSIFNATSVALGVLMGMFADRLGHRRVVVASLILLSVASLWGAAAASGAVLLLARFTEGIGFVGVVVSAPSIIAHATLASDRRLALGLWSAFIPAGIATALLAAPAILAPLGWRSLWMAVAGATVVWAAVASLMLRGYDPRIRRAHPAARSNRKLSIWKQDLRLTLGRSGLWLLAFSLALYTMQWMALMVWLPTFLVEQRGASVTLAAQLTVVVVMVNIIGGLLGGWLLQRGCSRWRLLAFVGILSILCGPGIFTDALPDGPRYLLCILFSGLAGISPATVMSGAPAFTPTPRQIGAANGLLVQGSNLGQLLGPPAVATAVAMAGSLQAGSWIFASCGLAALGLALALRRLDRS